MTGLADPSAAVRLTLDRARRLMAGGHGSVLQILAAADAELSKRLLRAAKRNGGGDVTYSEAHAQVYRDQIRVVMDYAKARLSGLTDEQAQSVIAASVASLVNLATQLEERYAGVTRPLSLQSQAAQDEIVRGASASRIRQNAASWERYGASLTREFETVMRVGQLAGLTQHEMISKMVRAGAVEGIDAKSLHEKWPAHFPPPTGFVNRTYWAERIVRTELANAYNEAGLNTIQELKNTDFPDMQKKILAHFDNRTAPDSVAVHGQVRPTDGYFVDGAGRRYLRPPARPNDRETVIPWRIHWQEVDETKQPPEQEVEKAVEEIHDRDTAKSRIQALAQERREQSQARRGALGLEREQARIEGLRKLEAHRQVLRERAAKKREQIQAKMAEMSAPITKEIYAVLQRYVDANVNDQRSLLDSLPTKLDRKTAEKFVRALGSKAPIEFAMSHPRVVAALKDKLEITEWEDRKVQFVVRDLGKVQPKLLHLMTQNGSFKGVYVGARKLTELDGMAGYANEHPRGWAPGSTWEEVGGAANGSQLVVAVHGNSGAESTILHELGHVVAARTTEATNTHVFVDQSDFFAEHHRRLFHRLNAYHQQGGPGGKAGMEETFADMFAEFHIWRREDFVTEYGQELWQWFYGIANR